MNPNDRPLGPYEERLLHELRSHVVARSEAGHGAVNPTGGRRLVRYRRRGPRLVLAGVAAAAVATGVIAATAGDDARAAYAVESNGDGTVTVEIRALEDAKGLEEKLRAAGVPAVVDYLPLGKTCKEPRFRTQAAARPKGDIVQSKSMMRQSKDGTTEFTIDRSGLQPGQSLVITTSTDPSVADGRGVAAIGMTIADGPVAPCEPVDAPLPGDGSAPAPAGASLNSGGGGAHDDGPGLESRTG